jgi:O-acetylhomoserine/O-acetylserine sulfhydrylase-like pyridoxal-dependent enzyme
VVPIYQNASFVFTDTDDAANLFALQKYGNVYSRIANPPVAAFEECVASLEGVSARWLRRAGWRHSSRCSRRSPGPATPSCRPAASMAAVARDAGLPLVVDSTASPASASSILCSWPVIWPISVTRARW